MIIVKEATTKKQMREFASFPLKLYKGNKYVCPPFYGDEKNLLNAKKNMYSDFTDTKCFLAYKDGKLAGRLAVQHNLYFYNTLMERIRDALDNGTFTEFRNKYSPLLASKLED